MLPKSPRPCLRNRDIRPFTPIMSRHALDLLEEHDDIALLLTDIVMPGTLNGADLALRVRKEKGLKAASIRRTDRWFILRGLRFNCSGLNRWRRKMSRPGKSDLEWQCIQSVVPDKSRGVKRVDDRGFIAAIVPALCVGWPLAELAVAYAPCTTVYNRFARWSKAQRPGHDHRGRCRGTQCRWGDGGRHLPGECTIAPRCSKRTTAAEWGGLTA